MQALTAYLAGIVTGVVMVFIAVVIFLGCDDKEDVPKY